MTKTPRFCNRVASFLRAIAHRLDHRHVVVVEVGRNADQMAAYLTALACKKGFEAWLEGDGAVRKWYRSAEIKERYRHTRIGRKEGA